MVRKSYSFAAAALSAALLSASANAQIFMNHDPADVHDGAYVVETSHTRVLFSVAHLGFTTWYGEFTDVTGSLNLLPESLDMSTLEIHIPTATVSTSNAILDAELKSGDWFDAVKFPEIVFKAVSVTKTGADTADVAGNLTFHGVTKPIVLKAKFNASGINIVDRKYTVGFEVSGLIKRSDFGIDADLPMIGDEVNLIISAAFVRE
jgi:polyisoprenoid-binding protein YceI